MLSTLGKIFSIRHFEIFFFFYFPKKQDLTFHANCLQWIQKTGFNISCKLSPMKTICMKCQILFSGENIFLADNLHEMSNPF